MDKIVRQLLDLTTCALHNEIYQQQIENGEHLFRIARESGISGMLFSSLIPKLTDAGTLDQFRSEFFLYNAKDMKQMESIERIEKLFNANQIDHVFLKGTLLKTLYPSSYMRSMGDIDILVKPESMQPIHHHLEQSGFRNPLNSENHDSFTKGKDIMVEIHQRVDVGFAEQWKSLFGNIWSHAVWVKEGRYEFEPAFNLTYLLCHMGKHFASSGVGLRSILDIGLFATKFHDVMDSTVLNGYLDTVGLRGFFGKILWLNHEYFKLNPYPEIVKNVNPDPTLLDDVTAFLISSGVHGKAENFNPSVLTITKKANEQQSISKGRVAYFFGVVFPNRKMLMTSRPYLQKNGWLLPYAWISRWFELLFKKTKHTWMRIKQLKVSKKQIETQAEIFRKLGL
jgi:hypothetical protein